MKLKLYNSLSRQQEEFKPIDPENIKLYVCGPTVYDYPHIGNARSVLVYDLLFRLLKYLYGSDKVTYVRNITDIDDKIINKAQQENLSIHTVSQKFTDIFHRNLEYLNCLNPTYEPKATEHINEMIEIIDRLLARKYAYVAENNHVYFAINKFSNYTKLANRKLGELVAGARVGPEQSKHYEGDFVLWKPANENAVGYNSPYGYGRPGWHLECSAMSHKFLGENFDIHGGGVDLIFPHHTNEMAQSCCAFDNANFANFWVHNGFVTVDGNKMSKSLDNFTTVEGIMNKIDGAVLRLALLSTHYHKPLDFNQKTLDDAAKLIHQLNQFEFNKIDSEVDNEFINFLCDDLNIAQSLAHLHKLIKNKETAKIKFIIEFLGLNYHTSFHHNTELSDEKIKELIAERIQAKQSKNWLKADEIRNFLSSNNIIIEDSKEDTKFYRR